MPSPDEAQPLADLLVGGIILFLVCFKLGYAIAGNRLFRPMIFIRWFQKEIAEYFGDVDV